MARQAHPVASPLLPRPLQQIVGFPIESLIVPRDRKNLLCLTFADLTEQNARGLRLLASVRRKPIVCASSSGPRLR